ncbi:MAG TPA: hypothetical protein VG817_08805 [Gemmatimonadales bacterium]|nr:hypothetical protein [Gemmatimonadales bacterium]
MRRKLAVLFGLAAGAALGWALSQQALRQHRADLFSANPLKRLTALTGLRGTVGVETVRLLRDYLDWERHPALRRQAKALVRRMEAALG